MGRRGKRTLKVEIDEGLVDKFEEVFCWATVAGEKVRVRTLMSVAREAIFRGIKVMVAEQAELRKIFKTDLLFLTETGIMFPESMVREMRMREAGHIE